MDLSGLGTFLVTASRLGIGDAAFPGVAVAQRAGGNLILAKTNVISLSCSDTLANYHAAGKNYSISMSRNAGNNPAIVSFLQLGITNTFYLDSMDIGMDKSGNACSAPRPMARLCLIRLSARTLLRRISADSMARPTRPAASNGGAWVMATPVLPVRTAAAARTISAWERSRRPGGYIVIGT